jgi:hypothetical protein
MACFGKNGKKYIASKFLFVTASRICDKTLKIETIYLEVTINRGYNRKKTLKTIKEGTKAKKFNMKFSHDTFQGFQNF